MSQLKRFVRYYKGNLPLFTLDMFCALIMAVADLFYPMITRNIMNDYIPNRNLQLIITWSIALIAIYVLKMILNYVVSYFGHLVGIYMQANMRRDVFARLQKLPFSYFDNHKTGSIMSRIVNDLNDISELAHHGPEDLFLSVIMLIGSFILLVRINWLLTVIIFVCLPPMIVFTILIRNRMLSAFKKTREETAEINARLENSISGIRVAKAFTNDSYENDRFAERNTAFAKAKRVAFKVMAEFHSVNTFFTDAMNVLVMALGGVFCYNGTITLGDFTAFMLYINLFLNPIRRLVSFIEQYQNGMSGFQRFTELMETAAEEDSPSAKDLKNPRGELRFKDVTFSYGEGKNVLKNVSLHVAPGRTIALVGPSGGGKTTICNLLPRFYEIDDGEIQLDGVNIKDITLRSLRESIGIVSQDVFLFTGTIYENIAYGNVNATRAQVEEAARRAKIDAFIASLPDGYDTHIGEHGIKLSGGQKQRISIARVFLKNPPILILDEATSALDNATENMIQESLEQLMSGRTAVVVAHRLSTVRRADEILVLTDNGIEERGTHDELLEKQGIYSELYLSQFKK